MCPEIAFVLIAERAIQASAATPRFHGQSTDNAQDGQVGAYVIPLAAIQPFSNLGTSDRTCVRNGVG